jgi:hypothetical protein
MVAHTAAGLVNRKYDLNWPGLQTKKDHVLHKLFEYLL